MCGCRHTGAWGVWQGAVGCPGASVTGVRCGNWAVGLRKGSMCFLTAEPPLPSFVHCWPPKIFRLPLSLLKRTRFSLQVAMWYDQRLEFYLRVDDHCFLGRLDLRPVCLLSVSWGKSLHGHAKNIQGKLAREDEALPGPGFAWLVLLLISLASGWKGVSWSLTITGSLWPPMIQSASAIIFMFSFVGRQTNRDCDRSRPCLGPCPFRLCCLVLPGLGPSLSCSSAVPTQTRRGR